MRLYFTNTTFSDKYTFEGFFDIDNVSAIDYKYQSGYYLLCVRMYRGNDITLYYPDNEEGVKSLKKAYNRILKEVKKRCTNNQNLT